MKFYTQAIRRSQLDRQLMTLGQAMPGIRPNGGWIKAIRESLGMTLDTFGKRLSVTRATAHQIEKAEQNESITIKRLRAAADALECDLVVTVVPRRSLDLIVSERAYRVAKKDFSLVNHSMLLEGQAVYDNDAEELVKEIAKDLISENDQRLWTSD